MIKAFPNSKGLAVDIPKEGPSSVSDMVACRSIDLNLVNFADQFEDQADVVYSNFAIEQALQPKIFLRNILRLVKLGSLLYVTAPDFSSLSRRMLGRRWPNIVPGEHLSIPSQIGAEACIQGQVDVLKLSGTFALKIRPIYFSYSLRYILQYFGLLPLARLIPAGFAIPTPAWAIMMALRRMPETAQ